MSATASLKDTYSTHMLSAYSSPYSRPYPPYPPPKVLPILASYKFSTLRTFRAHKSQKVREHRHCPELSAKEVFAKLPSHGRKVCQLSLQISRCLHCSCSVSADTIICNLYLLECQPSGETEVETCWDLQSHRVLERSTEKASCACHRKILLRRGGRGRFRIDWA